MIASNGTVSGVGIGKPGCMVCFGNVLATVLVQILVEEMSHCSSRAGTNGFLATDMKFNSLFVAIGALCCSGTSLEIEARDDWGGS